MSKRGYAHIITILDRSGSMRSCLMPTINGYNEFLSGQKAVEGEATLTRIQFDDQYEVLDSVVPIADITELSQETFVPRGMTALFDAIGRTITDTEHYFNNLPEEEKPETVTICILTDGDNNASREFTREQIFQMISRCEEEYNWTFLFVGANQDAIKEGSSFGIRAGQTLTYGANEMGTQAVYASLSKSVSKTRRCKSASDLRSLKLEGVFDQDDWDAQKGANAIQDIDKNKTTITTLVE